jgi:predicted nucleic acid-binding protein
VLKDAPHLASAIKAKAHYLVSLDRKHMIDVRNSVESNLGLKILLLSELLEEIRRKEEA